MTEPRDLFIVYDLWQVDLARSHMARGIMVVCLNFLVEQELKKQNIPHLSLRDIVDSDTGEEEWWLLAQEVAREWYRLPAMKFFEHGGIRIAEAIEPIMMIGYLTRLFYYTRIYISLKKTYANAHLYIPFLIVDETPTDDCLASFERRSVIDAVRMVGLRSTILGKSALSRKHSFFRTLRKVLFVRVYNFIMSFVPRRKFKIYASEYWSHIGPVIEKMDDAELILMNSGELKHIPWRQLLKHRIRFMHPLDEIRDAELNIAARISNEFVKQWGVAKKDVEKYLSSVRAEFDWNPVLESCEYLIIYATRVIAYIDALRRIMKKEKPNTILQLASVSDRYHYFFIIARIASQLDIPSIELQHASAYIDPRSVFFRLENEYLATYGTDTNSWHKSMGHESSRLIATGSPRFDKYLNGHVDAVMKGKQLFERLGLDATRPVLLAAVPFSDTNLFALDSYQLAEFFEAVHMAKSSVPGMQVLFKCRNYKYVGMTQEYIRELFHKDVAVTGDEDIFALLCASDAVVCGNSTIIYQTMLAKKPLVLYPWQVFDEYHAQIYEYAIPLVHSAKELVDTVARIFVGTSYRDELLSRQEHFLRGYSFDGKASERVATLLHELSQMKKPNTVI